MPESATTTAPSPNHPPAAHPRPELLAPAGDWECARAAVENGADAIYFGLEKFNARMRAHNFTAADLPELMRFLHRRGVKGYVTFNTLVFANELAEAEDYLRTIIGSGADAAIVQDVGVCRMIRALSPDFPIHCSTQMTISSAAGVAFARDLGANLVVLARENTLAEIEKIRAADGGAMPLEVFVHGALCVAYSGQCLTSESLGGRSANRGECAQACRMPYDLISDGREVPLGDRRYLLSPRDLAGIDVLPELVRSGVASLKIEGRLKSPEYVASITRTYRKALDALCGVGEGKLEVEGAPDGRAGHILKLQLPTSTFGAAANAARYELEMAFSRGLATGWFRGIDNQELVHARFGTKRGVFLGKVARVTHDGVLLRLEGPVKPGDGIVFDQGRHDEGEQGGRVYHVREHGAEHELTFGHDAVDLRRVNQGDRIWKTNDPALDRELRKTFEGDQPRFTRTVTAEVHGHAGVPLTLLLRDGEGRTVRADSTVLLARAETRPLTEEKLVAQLGRLGGTPFRLGTLVNKLDPGLMLPVSELNHVRRDAATRLEELRAQPPRWKVNTSEVGRLFPKTPFESGVNDGRVSDNAPHLDPELIASVRDIAQMEAAWGAGVRAIYCEFEDPKKYREAVARFRELQAAAGGDSAGSEIWVLPPRVSKPGEEWIHRIVSSCEPDGILARNYDHLTAFPGRMLRGDFSLNVANPWTVAHYRERHGIERLTASYDLNVTQLEALLGSTDAAALDITIHQHMPMFHMEHCVFCAFLSDGTDYRNCGRPCDRHDVRLRDRIGAEHPLKADAGCRNTVYNSRAQTGAEYVSRMIALGARHFRVDFLNEPPAEVARILGRYRQLLRGEIRGSDLWGEFKLINQLGVTRGQLDAPARVIVPKGGA